MEKSAKELRLPKLPPVGRVAPEGMPIPAIGIPPGIWIIRSEFLALFPKVDLLGEDQKIAILGFSQGKDFYAGEFAGNRDFSSLGINGRIQKPGRLDEEAAGGTVRIRRPLFIIQFRLPHFDERLARSSDRLDNDPAP